MNKLTINHRKIDFTLRRSRRARCLRLQVDSLGQLTLTAPWLASTATIYRFALEHAGWIDRQMEKAKQCSALRPMPRYRTGDTFYYFGEPVRLTVLPSDRKRPTLRIREDEMTICLHRLISESEGVEAVKKTIERWYRQKAEETVHDRLKFFNEHYGFRYRRVTLRNQKTRWGSCSSKGNLNFNWRLIMAPIDVIDYVVVHELCHLKEMNHSTRFWRLVSQTIPEHKPARKWLKDYHYLLTF